MSSQTSFVINGGWQGDLYYLLEPSHSSEATDQERDTNTHTQKKPQHIQTYNIEFVIFHPDGCCLTSFLTYSSNLVSHACLNLYLKTKCTPQHTHSRDTRVPLIRQPEKFLSKPL